MIAGSDENPTTYAADAGRLAALGSYDLLDTPKEDAFDGIVRLATETCAAPVGLITLVASDRQWFKARVGVEESQTPLDRSICVHVLPEAGTFVVPDLERDPRTRANLAVTGPSAFRFYARVPLRSPCGHGLGTLCVIDRRPREVGLTASQAGILRALGEQVMALFEARRVLRAREEEAARLKASEAFLHGVLAASPDCIKVLDLEGRLDLMNGPGLRAMDVDDFAAIAGAHWPGFWPAPTADKAHAAGAAARVGGESRFEGWANTLRGVLKFWEVTVTPINGADGRPERLLAISRDQTAVRRAADRQAALTCLGERLRELERPAEVVAEAAQAAVWALDLTRAAYGVVDRTENEISFERDYARPGRRSVVGRHRYSDYGRYVDDLRRGETVVIRDVRIDPRTASCQEALGRYGIGALVNVPAMADGRLVGVLCLHDAAPRDWTEGDVAFAQAVAERTRLALVRIATEELRQLRMGEVGQAAVRLIFSRSLPVRSGSATTRPNWFGAQGRKEGPSRLVPAVMPSTRIRRRARVTYTGKLTMPAPDPQIPTWKAARGASTVNARPSGA